MAKKIKVIIFTLFLSFGATSSVWASEEGGKISGLTLLLGLLAALLALGCFFWAWRIYTFLKKGELALPWQLLGLSFLFLGLAQLLEIGSGWLPLSGLSITLVRLVALGFLAFGLHRTARILG